MILRINLNYARSRHRKEGFEEICRGPREAGHLDCPARPQGHPPARGHRRRLLRAGARLHRHPSQAGALRALQGLQGAPGAVKIRLVLLLLLASAAARADRRSFIRAYEYATQPQGNLELELWNDVNAPNPGGFDL